MTTLADQIQSIRRSCSTDELQALLEQSRSVDGGRRLGSLAESIYECVELDDEWAWLRDERRAPYLELARTMIADGVPEPSIEFVLLNGRTSVTEGRFATLEEAQSARVGDQSIWSIRDDELLEQFEH